MPLFLAIGGLFQLVGSFVIFVTAKTVIHEAVGAVLFAGAFTSFGLAAVVNRLDSWLAELRAARKRKSGTA